MGSLRIAGVLRPEAVEAVRALREMSIRTVLLTGDTASIGPRLEVSSKSMMWRRNLSLSRSWIECENFAPPARSSRWSATGLMTLLR